MTNCWFCGAEMGWCDDSTYEDLRNGRRGHCSYSELY